MSIILYSCNFVLSSKPFLESKGFLNEIKMCCGQLLLRKKAAEELKKEQERKAAERRRIIEERCGRAKNLEDANEGTRRRDTKRALVNQHL